MAPPKAENTEEDIVNIDNTNEEKKATVKKKSSTLIRILLNRMILLKR